MLKPKASCGLKSESTLAGLQEDFLTQRLKARLMQRLRNATVVFQGEEALASSVSCDGFLRPMLMSEGLVHTSSTQVAVSTADIPCLTRGDSVCVNGVLFDLTTWRYDGLGLVWLDLVACTQR